MESSLADLNWRLASLIRQAIKCVFFYHDSVDRLPRRKRMRQSFVLVRFFLNPTSPSSKKFHTLLATMAKELKARVSEMEDRVDRNKVQKELLNTKKIRTSYKNFFSCHHLLQVEDLSLGVKLPMMYGGGIRGTVPPIARVCERERERERAKK